MMQAQRGRKALNKGVEKEGRIFFCCNLSFWTSSPVWALLP